MPKLTIELVPQSVWNLNLRSILKKKEWDKLRKDCYKQAEYKCEICGGIGPKHPVECHEIWDFDDANKVQTLTGLVSLCPKCHMVKHIGFASVSGKRDLAFNQLKKINDWDDYEADDYVAECFQIWNERSKDKWKLDIDWAYCRLEELVT